MPVDYLYDNPPAAGEVQRLDCVPGSAIGWMYMPLPFALDHVNLWFLGDPESGPLACIDTGIQSGKSKQLWDEVLANTRKPSELLVTHYHPDHIGLAGWLIDKLDCPCYMTANEIEQARQAHGATDKDFSQGQSDWYHRQGLDAERVAEVTAFGNTYRPIVSELPKDVVIIAAGDSIELGGVAWQVMTGGGHSSEQICLYSKELNVLISADQVLPRITPNVSLVWYKQEGDPLANFIQSLDMFRDLPEDVVVLPSHGLPFRGLHGRIQYLKDHHKDRLDLIVQTAKQPMTATELMPVLFRRELDPRQLMFAMGECLSHIRFLTNSGQLQMRHINGIDHFTAT